ncbi:MAG TPA: hypothetical protein PLR58_06000 [Bacteroides graminisolvens]|jgi:hypothetical protein|nr:hypothetical protein [Bacteroides graminisolvens]
MMPIHGMKVTRLTSGDLTDVLKSADNNCCEKSAEVIVDTVTSLKKKQEVLRSVEGQNRAV